MSWDAVGAIGEFVGALAVLVTLVYIAVQVRDTRRLALASARRERSDAFVSPFMQAPQLAEIAAKIGETDGQLPIVDDLSQRYGLATHEAELWQRYLALVWRGIERDFLWETGREMAGVDGLIKVIGDIPSYRRLLPPLHVYPSDFVLDGESMSQRPCPHTAIALCLRQLVNRSGVHE